MQQLETQKQQILTILFSDLEAELKGLDLWKEIRPSEEKLASVEPFAIDTLSFPEWLQFVFIEKMTQLLQANLPLPDKIAITPMAIEYFKILAINSKVLIKIIMQIDVAINEKIKC